MGTAETHPAQNRVENTICAGIEDLFPEQHGDNGRDDHGNVRQHAGDSPSPAKLADEYCEQDRHREADDDGENREPQCVPGRCTQQRVGKHANEVVGTD